MTLPIHPAVRSTQKPAAPRFRGDSTQPADSPPTSWRKTLHNYTVAGSLILAGTGIALTMKKTATPPLKTPAAPTVTVADMSGKPDQAVASAYYDLLKQREAARETWRKGHDKHIEQAKTLAASLEKEPKVYQAIRAIAAKRHYTLDATPNPFQLMLLDAEDLSAKTLETFPSGIRSDWAAMLKLNRQNQKDAEGMGAVTRQLEAFREQYRPRLMRFWRQAPLSPDLVKKEKPLPPFVRSLAVSTQQESAFGGEFGVKEAIAKSEVAFAKAMAETGSLNEAFDRMHRDVLVEDGRHWQKPVATPRDPKTWSRVWRKDENTNAHVHRVAILVETDDILSQDDFHRSLETLKSGLQDPRTGYRIDKVIVVKPPTTEELINGETIQSRVLKAFKDAKAFRTEHLANQPDSEKQADAERFECFVAWVGHGGARENPATQASPDLKLKEGTMDFILQLNHGFGLSDKGRKLLLEELEGFQVLEYISTCHSGAGIAAVSARTGRQQV